MLEDAFHCEIYSVKNSPDLDVYMKSNPPVNNSSFKNLLMHKYDGKNGDLFLLYNQDNKICGMTSIITEQDEGPVYARIYSRLHIEVGVPHYVIDKYFEPQLFEWCKQRSIQHLYTTVNEGNERVLRWVSLRLGSKRAKSKENQYYNHPSSFRSNFRPTNYLILERQTWQYCFYCSPDGNFGLKKERKSLPPEITEIFVKDFPDETRHWL